MPSNYMVFTRIHMIIQTLCGISMLLVTPTTFSLCVLIPQRTAVPPQEWEGVLAEPNRHSHARCAAGY